MISLRIDPELEDELRLAAEAKGVSKSEYLRNLIIEKLKEERTQKKSPWELGSHLFGRFESGRSDLSKNRKSILKDKLHAKTRGH